VSELSPTYEHLSDPYVLQLIEALSMQQDEIEDLTQEIKALKHNIEYYQEQLEGIQGILGIKLAKEFIKDIENAFNPIQPDGYPVVLPDNV